MPTLYVIAGPNGIGKTTSAYDIIPRNIAIINSDEIAKEARIAGLITGNAQEYSNREAIRLMEEQRQQENTFAIETNLADIDTWKFLIEMQKTGYLLHIIFMSANSIHLLNKRIWMRYQLGEHFVSSDIVWERYINGLNLLAHYFSHPDILELFDNSFILARMVLVSKGNIMQRMQDLPTWITDHFNQYLIPGIGNQRSIHDMSIDEIRNVYKEKNKKQNE